MDLPYVCELIKAFAQERLNPCVQDYYIKRDRATVRKTSFWARLLVGSLLLPVVTISKHMYIPHSEGL